MLLAGVQRYARYCEATGRVGTEYVKQGRTFFGPGRHFEEPWELPSGLGARPGPARARANAGEQGYANALAALEDLAPGSSQRVPA